MVGEFSGCVLDVGIGEKENDGMKGHDSFNDGSADPANTCTELSTVGIVPYYEMRRSAALRGMLLAFLSCVDQCTGGQAGAQALRCDTRRGKHDT